MHICRRKDRTLGCPRRRWKIDIDMYHKEVGYDVVDRNSNYVTTFSVVPQHHEPGKLSV